MTYILLLIMVGGSSNVITPVYGFSSKQECIAAGTQAIAAFNSQGWRQLQFTCLPQEQPK